MGGSIKNVAWRGGIVSQSKINIICDKQLTLIPPNQNPIALKANTGASKHYIKPKEKQILADNNKIQNGSRTGLPDGSMMKTIETGTLPQGKFLLEMF